MNQRRRRAGGVGREWRAGRRTGVLGVGCRGGDGVECFGSGDGGGMAFFLFSFSYFLFLVLF